MNSRAARSGARREVVGAVYRTIPLSVWFTIGVTWVMVYLLWGAVRPQPLIAWALLCTAINLARIAHALARMRRIAFLDDPRREARRLAIGLFLAGTGLAFGFVLFAQHAPLLEQHAITLFVVTLSAGVASLTPGTRHTSAQTLVNLAGEGPYQARKRGRNRVVVRDADEPVSLAQGLAPP